MGTQLYVVRPDDRMEPETAAAAVTTGDSLLPVIAIAVIIAKVIATVVDERRRPMAEISKVTTERGKK